MMYPFSKGYHTFSKWVNCADVSETNARQRPFYIPVLARIPIVGPMVQFPRSPKVTRHESVILANAVILPRSVELQRFYSQDLAATPASPKTEAE